jgi:hypothetical protein
LPKINDSTAIFAKEFIKMGRSFTPFTRITLLLSEVKDRKINELADTTKCDLLYHTEKLSEEVEDSAQKELIGKISEQSKNLLAELKSNNLEKAEEVRQIIVSDCKKLKDLL